jgi:hypothetical protein
MIKTKMTQSKNIIVLHIAPTQTIRSVQKQFNDLYSYLKLEFFRQAPVSGAGNTKNKMFTYDMKLMDIQSTQKSGEVNVAKQTLVSELENEFENKFGLYVQVFRKSGRIWLETTATDNWTLEQQNEEGKSLDEHLNIQPENPDEHDIY